MKKNKIAFAVVAALSVLAAAVRLCQLFSINEQGIVVPGVVSIAFYALIAAGVLFAALFVRKADFENVRGAAPVLTLCVKTAVIVCCAAVMLESIAGLISQPRANTAGNTVMLVGAAAAAAYMLLRVIKKRIPALALGACLLLVLASALNVITIFIEDQTILSTVLNFPSICEICALLFFIKSFSKVLLTYSDEPTVKAALMRSSLALILLLPAKILGSAVCGAGLLVSMPVSPARAGVLSIVTDTVLLACAVLTALMLLSGKKTTENAQ